MTNKTNKQPSFKDRYVLSAKRNVPGLFFKPGKFEKTSFSKIATQFFMRDIQAIRMGKETLTKFFLQVRNFGQKLHTIMHMSPIKAPEELYILVFMRPFITSWNKCVFKTSI
jgi:hypothetical protein